MKSWNHLVLLRNYCKADALKHQSQMEWYAYMLSLFEKLNLCCQWACNCSWTSRGIILQINHHIYLQKMKMKRTTFNITKTECKKIHSNSVSNVYSQINTVFACPCSEQANRYQAWGWCCEMCMEQIAESRSSQNGKIFGFTNFLSFKSWHVPNITKGFHCSIIYLNFNIINSSNLDFIIIY